MKNRIIAVIIFFMITGILAIFTSGCAPINVYRPIDAIDIYERPLELYRREVVYIPRYRPMRLYHFNGMWYDEPYTRMLYQNLNGKIQTRRIPRSILRQMNKKIEIKRRPYRRLPEENPNKRLHNDRKENRNRIRIQRSYSVGS